MPVQKTKDGGQDNEDEHVSDSVILQAHERQEENKDGRHEES